MRRLILSALCLLVFVGLASAQAAKEERVNKTGKFKSFKDGTLTIETIPVLKGEVTKEMSFKVPDDVKCTVWTNGEMKADVLAKDVLKETKADRYLRLTAVDGKIINLIIGSKTK